MGLGGCKSFTRREWFTLVSIGSVNFATAICISLQAPFYPQEAENKGATASEYGLVFGIFEFVVFIVSPIFGKYMDKLGAKFLLQCGTFLAGSSSILFGLLALVDGHDLFIGFSFAIRIVESLGSAAALTASFAIIATVFPNSMATTFATLEVLYGVGNTIGPTVGGGLFALGGFKLPFIVMGAVLLLDGLFICMILPNVEDNVRDRPQAKLWSFMKLPPVLLNSLSVTAAAIGTGYYSATLEPHLRQFGLSPVVVGLMFVISGGCYAITAPFVGRLCDKTISPKKMIIAGCLVAILSFLLVGPAPFTPFETTLWMCCLGLVFHGIGNSCILVPAFIDCIRSAVICGLPDDITTYGMVSGIWSASYALGAFLGPSVAGVLYDSVGFRLGTLFVICIDGIMAVSLVTFLCVDRRPTRPPPPADDKAVINLVAHWHQKDLSPSNHVIACNGTMKSYGSVNEGIAVC